MPPLLQFEREQFDIGNSGIRNDLISKMDKFEKGLGVVLRNAWSHIEAIQTTDLPLLIDYCSQVVKFGLENKEFVSIRVDDGTLCERQEIVSIHYIMDLMSQVESIGEDRLMPLMKEKKGAMSKGEERSELPKL